MPRHYCLYVSCLARSPSSYAAAIAYATLILMLFALIFFFFCDITLRYAATPCCFAFAIAAAAAAFDAMPFHARRVSSRLISLLFDMPDYYAFRCRHFLYDCR